MRNTRVVVSSYGGADKLRVIEEDCPEPRPGEVRIRVQRAGVSLPDVMAREGVHPETPPVPFTPGWDLVGVIDRLGEGVSGFELGQVVAALPIHGAYATFVCLPASELFLVPPGVDPSEVVALGLNYVTAYQMLHRSAKVQPGQTVLVHGAAGGVGTALLQLGRVAGLRMYGTCSARGASVVRGLGATAIDYREQDYIQEIRRLTEQGVEVVFDPIGGHHLWQSRGALRHGGKVVGYGLTTALRGKELSSTRPGRRQRFRGTLTFALYIVGGWLLPGRRRVIPYSIQTLKRVKPDWFRQDFTALLGLLEREQIKPIVAHTFALSDARDAHELLEKGGIAGKIVLVCSDAAQTVRAAPAA